MFVRLIDIDNNKVSPLPCLKVGSSAGLCQGYAVC